MNSLLTGFLVQVGVRLAIKLHKGPCHELAEKFRKEIEAEAQKRGEEVKNEKT